MTENDATVSDAEKMREFLEDRTRRRHEILEDETRRLRNGTRLLTLGLLLALGLNVLTIFWPNLLGMGQGADDSGIVHVRHLVLEDAGGTARGEWQVDEEGNSRFTLADRQGHTRLSLSVLSGGSPGLSLIDALGQKRAALGLLPDQTTNLVFADDKGMPRAVLGLNRSDATHLVFADANGSSQVALGLDGSGVGTFMVPEEVPAGAQTEKNEG